MIRRVVSVVGLLVLLPLFAASVLLAVHSFGLRYVLLAVAIYVVWRVMAFRRRPDTGLVGGDNLDRYRSTSGGLL